MALLADLMAAGCSLMIGSVGVSIFGIGLVTGAMGVSMLGLGSSVVSVALVLMVGIAILDLMTIVGAWVFIVGVSISIDEVSWGLSNKLLRVNLGRVADVLSRSAKNALTFI